MAKKNYLIVAIIVIVLLIAGGIYLLKPQAPISKYADCNSLSLNEKENCYANIAVNQNDSAPCYKIESQNMKELCYASVASVNYNPAVCENIKESNLKNQCFATAKNDTSYCANVREDMKVYPCVY